MQTRILTDKQIARIHTASLTILEKTGVTVPHEDMLNRFEEAGAAVDRDAQRVHIPADLVADSVEAAGKQFSIYGRNKNQAADFGRGTRNYNSVAGEAHWVEETGALRRYASMNDVATAARFCDALTHINIVGAMADPHETAAAHRSVEVCATLVRNTTKPVTFWYHDRASAKYINEILIALRGDEKAAEEYPLCYPFLEPISPLRFPFNGIDLLYETARLNLPVPIGPMAQMGLSAPCTIAGTMAIENAEILAGICITQLIKSGTPVCYGGICHAFDMGSTQMIFCGPEQAIFGVAMTQMGKYYGLPVYINVGLTDSKRPDAQAGMEAGITLAMGAAAGADIFGHMGICGVDQGSSLEILVLQNEIISYVESSMRDLDISDEALGLDVIDKAGPGGTFIDTQHTAEYFRQELWFPRLLNREYYQAWHDAGAESTEDRCKAETKRILADHEPEPISDDLDRALADIVEAARRNLS
jgi:trimethylamine---corrinoid protein Co-methyltransferase